MHKLEDTPLGTYLAETGESLNTLALRIGIAPSTLTRAVRGLRAPTFALAFKVEKGTGGKVTADQFIGMCLQLHREQQAGGADPAEAA